MKKLLFGGLAPALVSMNLAVADEVPVAVYKATVVAAAPRFYGDVEYLLWGVKGAPLAVPLVTTGPRANDGGVILNSNTTILYGAPLAPAVGGKDTQNFPLFSGGRITLGYWLDQAEHVALEGSAFALQPQTAGFEAASSASGSPDIHVPLFNTTPFTTGGARDRTIAENEFPVSIPGILSENISIWQ